jgi:GcrA cell cycle regulator
MDWTEETISRLQELWQQGLSTAEIGRQLGITKNAVVGKAHRLSLPPRPSPIRKPAPVRASAEPVVERVEPESAQLRPPEETASAAPVAPVAEVAPSEDETIRESASVVSILARRAAETSADATPAEDVPEPAPRSVPRPVLRSVPPEPRRRGPSCCWPLGDPGTPGFHFCGAAPLSGKPYCAEHAAIAYVKLRDRRDSVA